MLPDLKTLLNTDAFTLFGYAPTFDVDLSKLNAQLHKLQQQYHPDTSQDNATHELLAQASAYINEAYTTLTSPLERAQLLLKIAGYKLDLTTDTALPAEFLTTQLDLHEQLNSARHNKDVSLLTKLEDDVTQKQQVLVKHLTKAFTHKDYTTASNLTKQLAFYTNFLKHVTNALYQLD